MRWIKALRPVDGAGSWSYPCEQTSIKGRVCVLPDRHGRMHKDATQYFWPAA